MRHDSNRDDYASNPGSWARRLFLRNSENGVSAVVDLLHHNAYENPAPLTDKLALLAYAGESGYRETMIDWRGERETWFVCC